MEPKLKSYIISVLRRASYRTWKPRNEVLKKARVERGKYKCAICLSIVGRKEVCVDHKSPIVPVAGWDNWDMYMQRLFCPVEELQVICRKPCHSEKSKFENKLRRENKKCKK